MINIKKMHPRLNINFLYSKAISSSISFTGALQEKFSQTYAVVLLKFTAFSAATIYSTSFNTLPPIANAAIISPFHEARILSSLNGCILFFSIVVEFFTASLYKIFEFVIKCFIIIKFFRNKVWNASAFKISPWSYII